MRKILAAAGKDIGTIGGEGLGPFGTTKFTGGTEAMKAVTNAISAIVGFLTVVASIWFLFQFLIGGITWISAGGDKTKLNEARDRITSAFVGLIVVVAGWSILALAGQFFGWKTILSPEDVIKNFQF